MCVFFFFDNIETKLSYIYSLAAIEVDLSKIYSLVYSVYRSPNSNIDSDLYELNDIILRVYYSYLKLASYNILPGDINIDSLKQSKLIGYYLQIPSPSRNDALA